jgi:hypothetical protein
VWLRAWVGAQYLSDGPGTGSLRIRVAEAEHLAEAAELRAWWQSLLTQFQRWQQHNSWFADERNEVDPEFRALEAKCRGKQREFAADLEAFIQHIGPEHAAEVFELLVAVDATTREARAAV